MLPLLEAFEMDAWKSYLNFLEYYEAASHRPTVALVGEFSAGKTSLIEALLESEIGVIDALESTKCPVYFVYGEKPHVYAYSKQNPKVQSFQLSSITRLTASSEKKDWLLVTMPNEELKRMNLLDTPGFNANATFNLEFVSFPTYAWCLPYGDVLSETQLTTLSQIGAAHLIATKADLVDEDEEDEFEELYVEIQESVPFQSATLQSSLWLNRDHSLRKNLWDQLVEWAGNPSKVVKLPLVKKLERDVSVAISKTAKMKYDSIEQDTDELCDRYLTWDKDYADQLKIYAKHLAYCQQEGYSILFNMIWKNEKISIDKLIETTSGSFKEIWSQYNNFSINQEEQHMINERKEQILSLIFAMKKRIANELPWSSSEQRTFDALLEKSEILDRWLSIVIEKQKERLEDVMIEDAYHKFIKAGRQHLDNIENIVDGEVKQNYLEFIGEITPKDQRVQTRQMLFHASLKQQADRDRELMLIHEMEQALTSIQRRNLYLIEEILKNAPREEWGLPTRKEIWDNPWKAIMHSLVQLAKMREIKMKQSKEWKIQMNKGVHSLEELEKNIHVLSNKLREISLEEENEWSFMNQVIENVIADSKTLIHEIRETDVFTYKSIYDKVPDPPNVSTEKRKMNIRKWKDPLLWFDTLSMTTLFVLLCILGPFMYLMEQVVILESNFLSYNVYSLDEFLLYSLGDFIVYGIQYIKTGIVIMYNLVQQAYFLALVVIGFVGSLIWIYISHRRIEKKLLKSGHVGEGFTIKLHKTAKMGAVEGGLLIVTALGFVQLGNVIFNTYIDANIAAYFAGAVLPFLLFKRY